VELDGLYQLIGKVAGGNKVFGVVAGKVVDVALWVNKAHFNVVTTHIYTEDMLRSHTKKNWRRGVTKAMYMPK
jgi:hypothetical protein